MSTLAEIRAGLENFIASLDFRKGEGLIPTIVADLFDGRPRCLAYSNEESLRTAVREGRGVYWSRSRRALWRKGETSGNIQRLVAIDADCDADALIFYVEQSGQTCHTGADRCFPRAGFCWHDLTARIAERARGSGSSSYTRELLRNPQLLQNKILEEAVEVVQARTKDEVAWECADLLYFMSVKMQSAGVMIAEVMAQLDSRAN